MFDQKSNQLVQSAGDQLVVYKPTDRHNLSTRRTGGGGVSPPPEVVRVVNQLISFSIES